MTPMREKFLRARREENAIVLYINIHGEPVMQQHGYTRKLPYPFLRLEIGNDADIPGL